MPIPEEIVVFAPKSSKIKQFSYGAGFVDVEFSESEEISALTATVTDEATIERLITEEPFVWMESLS